MTEVANKKSHYHDRSLRFRTFLLGILLLVFGVLLLLSRAGVLELNFSRIIAFMILAVGGFEALTAFASFNGGTHFANRRRLFWGSALFLTGILIGLISYDFIPDGWDQIWPSALLIPGLAFLMLYFSNPKEYSLIIVAALFMAAGLIGLFFVKVNLNFGENLFDMFRFLVPAAIILAGFYVIWKNFFRIK